MVWNQGLIVHAARTFGDPFTVMHHRNTIAHSKDEIQGFSSPDRSFEAISVMPYCEMSGCWARKAFYCEFICASLLLVFSPRASGEVWPRVRSTYRTIPLHGGANSTETVLVKQLGMAKSV